MKRGIILLLNNIAIRFNKKDFEYDVYSLVKAFYPQAQITMFYEGEEEKLHLLMVDPHIPAGAKLY